MKIIIKLKDKRKVEKEKKPLKVLNDKKKSLIIQKVNFNTVAVNGVEICLKDYPKIKAGTDCYIYKEDGKYHLTDFFNLDHNCIGGFHYGLIPNDFKKQYGISEKRANNIAGINKYSIWTKKHRPSCDPKGMVYIKELDFWVDIYLCNSNYKQVGTSCSNGNILAGDNEYGRVCPKDSFGYKEFEEVAKKLGKRFLTKDEFQKATDGVKENCSAEDLDNGTIKYIDFLTSKYGLIQATGVQWVWSSDIYKEDDKRYILGGDRVHGVYASSRASHWNYVVWSTNWDNGCRFACDSLKPVRVSESEL